MNKETTIFIDAQDMEERYGEQLYQEYLENENKKLKEKVNQLEEENKKLNAEIQHIKNDNIRLATSKNVRYTYGLR